MPRSVSDIPPPPPDFMPPPPADALLPPPPPPAGSAVEGAGSAGRLGRWLGELRLVVPGLVLLSVLAVVFFLVPGKDKRKKGTQAAEQVSETGPPPKAAVTRPFILGAAGGGHETRESEKCRQPDLEKAGLDNIRALVKRGDGPELAESEPDDLDVPGLVLFLDAMMRPHPRKPGWARSLRAFRNVRIRYAPDLKSDEVGLLAVDSRIHPRGYVRAQGCAGGWLAIGPRAYVCQSGFVWDKRPPGLRSYPLMDRDDVTPGRYAYVRPGGTPVFASRAAAAQNRASKRLPMGFFVRFKRFCSIAGKNHWKTTKNWYVPVNRLARHVPSVFKGVDLLERGLGLPLLITRAEKNVFQRPGGTVIGKVNRHTAWPILGAVRVGRYRRKYYRIGTCRWIRAAGTRTAWPSRPPPGVRQGQQWVDINLKRQMLTAYVGKIPVFATMVSTGNKEHPTRHGIYRVYWKVTETDMTNEMGAEERYMAESVPWSLFFWKGQALHGTYWHDQFGYPRSHGCVNLSPRDARFLFEWANPDLPDGWVYRWSGERFPGLLVRIRRDARDRVRFFGFARKFAPASEVRARDEAYRRRIHAETVEMLRGKDAAGLDDEDDDPEDNPKAEVPSPNAAAPAGKAKAGPAVRPPGATRKGKAGPAVRRPGQGRADRPKGIHHQTARARRLRSRRAASHSTMTAGPNRKPVRDRP